MPNIPDQIRLPKDKDRRRKLTDMDKEIIKGMYKKAIPIREIARRFEHKCSRRLIQYVIFPERDKIQKDRVKAEKRWLKYYDREKHNKAIKSLRNYKRALFNIKHYKQGQKPTKEEKESYSKLIN